MGSDTFHVIGIKPPDDKWKKMKAIYDACEAAGEEAPKSVYEFFNKEPPDPKGVVVGLSIYTMRAAKRHHPCLEDYSADSQEGIEIDLSKVPEGIKIIRVSHHY